MKPYAQRVKPYAQRMKPYADTNILPAPVLCCISTQIQSEAGAGTTARHAAGRIFRLEDDSLLIDPLGEDGAKGPSRGSAIEFSGVKFVYPRRPDAQVGKKNH